LSLKMQGRHRAAFDAFYKAIWNAEPQAAGYFELARLAAHSQRFDEALDLTTRSLRRNWLHHPARHLRIALLRRQGHTDEATQIIEEALTLDRFEYGALWEQGLLGGEDATRHLRGDVHTFVDLALNYAHAGLFDEAVDLLQRAPQDDPMPHYYRGWVLAHAGQQDAASEAFAQAATTSTDFCYPNRLESVLALQAAIAASPQDAHAPYLLGNFWYAHRRYDEAIDCWEQARALEPSFATVQRNLGLAYYNKRQDAERAQQAYETAFTLDPGDGRVLFELDQLYKRRNRAPADRLSLLEQHSHLVDGRDDLTIERITLLNVLGRHDEAYRRIIARNFHPWEGGEGKVTAQYVWSLVERARQAIDDARYADAVADLGAAQVYPPNLGEGKLYGAQENHIFYHLGRAYAGMGNTQKAEDAWQRAAVGLSEPSSAMFYNDQPPDMIFYQGLARRALGREDDARIIFRKLIDYGRAHMDDDVQIDYFAVSLPDFLVFDEDLQQRNRIHCHYMMALGHLGLGETNAADAHFNAVLALRADHLGAQIHRGLSD
ncbi:MAG: tetratricopeptide repeat protein, partial [Caldilineaceae bacterium]|nr:tetratricopeptide repeat protein [Caldilineaceae bacterium]